MEPVYIIDALRTPIGKQNGKMKNISPAELSAAVIRELVIRKDINVEEIEELILGNAVSAGLGQNPARQAVLKSGLPAEVSAYTVNEVCGSGLKSVVLAAQSIACGSADVIAAGGAESASMCPYFYKGRIAPDEAIKSEQMENSLINDGLWCSLTDVHMGSIADETARKHGVSREEQDEYSVESYRKAHEAQEKGYFSKEIVPVKLEDGTFFDHDERIRPDTSIKKLKRLKPAFNTEGTVTAGNSPAPADGAAMVLLASGKWIKQKGIKPRAKITGYASVAVKPEWVFEAASKAIEKCLKKALLKKDEVGLFDVNESFAVQSLVTLKLAKISKNIFNIYGGTVALGHPLGASGARGLVTLVNAMQEKGVKKGITAVCLGGGCAVAMSVEII